MRMAAMLRAAVVVAVIGVATAKIESFAEADLGTGQKMKIPVTSDMRDIPADAIPMDVNYGGERAPQAGDKMPDAMKAKLGPEAVASHGGVMPPTRHVSGRMGDSGTRPAARRKDLKYVMCAACEEATGRFFKIAQNARKSNRKVSEDFLNTISDEICDPDSVEGGRWLKEKRLKAKQNGRVEIVNDVDKDSCGKDCTLLALACQETFGEHETDIVELFYRGQTQRAALTNFACREEGDACVKKSPALPKNHWLFKRQAKNQKKKTKNAKKSAKEEL